MAKASIDLAGVTTFEVGVDEVIVATRELLKHTKQAKVRSALARMSKELRKANKELVEQVLAPLYEIQSQEDFDARFAKLRGRYKAMILQGRPVLAKVNCYQVQQQLERLRDSQQWKKRIPFFRRSVARLELVATGWIADDSALYVADREMLDEIDRFLDEVEATRETDPRAAYRQLREALEAIQDSWTGVRDNLAELSLLGDQIAGPN
jgi:hypothetical protein